MKVSLFHRDGSTVLDEAGAATWGGFGELPGACLLITGSAECCGHTVGRGRPTAVHRQLGRERSVYSKHEES